MTDTEESKGVKPIQRGFVEKNYKWDQNLKEITICVVVPNVRGKDIDCKIEKRYLKVGIKGQPPIIDGQLKDEVKSSDSTWLLDKNPDGDGKEKKNDMAWWSCVIVGHTEIDCKKIEPMQGNINEMDAETRKTVEKVQFDTRQKMMGKPVSEDLQKMEILEKFKKQHPEMDFSQAKMGGQGMGGMGM